ncbi:MAG TPA: FKBP-type peptidyl-prolyl cis-trans isomerase [Usitatibacter sp.]|nr:FKBP-type peptidyl-prolyl cis-trans isomerase [Usitatibacter sp.]
MKTALRAALAAVVAVGIAHAADDKKDEAKGACVPPPTELVKKDLKEGDGKTVAVHSPTLVQYTGWLYDPCAPDHKGKQFDSSRGRAPMSFIVGAGRVIKGWDEGVQGMKVHGSRLLVIPPDKAYGERSVGNGLIPPHSTLVFEVEVVGVVGEGMSSIQVPRQ